MSLRIISKFILVAIGVSILITIVPQTSESAPVQGVLAISFRLPFDGNPPPSLGYAGKPESKPDYPKCYAPTKWKDLYHAAEDWKLSTGQNVYAVANGKVVWFDPSYNYSPGQVVIIKHTLSNRTNVFSMYGHLTSVQVYQGKKVSKGDVLGTVIDQGSNTHLHWEIRDFLDGSSMCSNPNAHPGVAGPGYTVDYPDNHGYLRPSEFVQSHQGGERPAAPTNVTATAVDMNRIQLSWKDNSNNEKGFRIFDGDKIEITTAPNVVSMTVTNLPPGTWKCFAIAAFNDYGWSDWTSWACTRTKAEYFKIVVQHSNKCLDVWEYSANPGQKIVQWECHGLDNQLWRVETLTGGYRRFVNKYSQLCLDVYNEATTSGAQIIQWHCHNGGNQQWALSNYGNQVFEIKNRKSSRCLDITSASTADGANVIQWTCNGGNNQRWKLVSVGQSSPGESSNDDFPTGTELDPNRPFETPEPSRPEPLLTPSASGS